jgi:hypothetical protein
MAWRTASLVTPFLIVRTYHPLTLIPYASHDTLGRRLLRFLDAPKTRESWSIAYVRNDMCPQNINASAKKGETCLGDLCTELFCISLMAKSNENRIAIVSDRYDCRLYQA